LTLTFNVRVVGMTEWFSNENIGYKKTLTFIVRVVGVRSEISNLLKEDLESVAAV
jgi:hypothetical protein